MRRSLTVLPLSVVVALALGTVPALAASVKLGASLAGANEPGGGDADGSGSFAAEIDADTGDVCYTLTADRIGKAGAAHIHTGAAGVNGPPVVTLTVTGATGDQCVAAEPDVLKPIVANPDGYYVNVHNAEFPAGAIRGQLAKK